MPDRVEEDAGIERLQQCNEVVEREASGLKRAGDVGAQAVLQHGSHGCKKAERTQSRRRDKDAQKGLRLHCADVPATQRAGAGASSRCGRRAISS